MEASRLKGSINLFRFEVTDCLPSRTWPKIMEISRRAAADEDEPKQSTVTIFSKLTKASKDRRHILEVFELSVFVPKFNASQCLPEMSVKTRSIIPIRIKKDNMKIAAVLQELFELNYKKDIAAVPQEHTITVLNLTHSVRAIRHKIQ